MQILIVGCGKVGYTLVDRLSHEGHDITVIDKDEAALELAKAELDAMCIEGDGLNTDVLSAAGASRMDMIIAVTGSDEQNLLCCLIAKKGGRAHTVARVRNPIYSKQAGFLKKEFGIAMVVNPELETAIEMSRVFQFPSALKIDTFANAGVELLQFKIPADSKLNEEKVCNIRNKFNSNVLIAAVFRDDYVIIPNGDLILRANDKVSLVGRRADFSDFLNNIGMSSTRIHSVMIAGGGKISYYLAQSLLRAKKDVTIIERDVKRCEELNDLLPEATVINGDATDQRLLDEEGVEGVQGFAALTGLDEENILLSLYVKGISKAKIITKINRINFTNVINNLNMDCVVNPRVIMADRIAKYIRSFNNSENSNVESLYKLEDGKAEALEFKITEMSEITGVPLKDMKLKKNTLICCIVRDGKIIIPGGNDTILVNDSVIVIIADYMISDIKDILRDN